MKHIIKYYKNGNKGDETYFNDLGQYHNENGPAHILYDESGNKNREYHYINGRFNNINGPACIGYGENGIIIFKFYWFNNELINVKTDEEFQKYVNRLNIS